MISTLIGLIGFTTLPTAPPRLLPGAHGFMDTMAHVRLVRLVGHRRQRAPRPGPPHQRVRGHAEPARRLGPVVRHHALPLRPAARACAALGVVYPLATPLVVMGTANHYLLDAAAGVLVMGVGFLLTKPVMRVLDLAHAKHGRPERRSRSPAPPRPARRPRPPAVVRAS